MKRVNFILRKNHFIFEPFKDLSRLMNYLRSSKSIFVRSLNKIMPCKFFTGRLWLKSKRFADMFMEEDFFPVILKTDESTARIKQILLIYSYDDWIQKMIFLKRTKLYKRY